MVQIKELTKIYKGGKKAVDNVSIKIESGDIYGFIGHNGAGKTTTLKCLTGILEFEIGEIFIDGKSVKNQPVECKAITAYIPDNPDLYESMTGIQYINFVADIYRVEKSKRLANIEKYSELFEMTKNLGDSISSYSHGMKQKIALISAFVHEPKLIVMDEPFVGLDPKASFTLKEIMREFAQNSSSIFFSTHVLEVAEKLCNKVAIINNGVLVANGTTDEIRGDSSLEQLFMELTDKQ